MSATHGCIVTRLPDLTHEKLLERVITLDKDSSVTPPKALLTKEFQSVIAYPNSHGYLIVATNEKRKSMLVWECATDWKHPRLIRDLPALNSESTQAEWDFIQHRLAIVQYTNNDARSVQIGVVDEATAKYIPVISVKQAAVVGWAQGRLVLTRNDYVGGINSHKILHLDIGHKSVQTLYAESGEYKDFPTFQMVAISPDQTQLAFDRMNPWPEHGAGIWMFDFKSHKCVQVTFGSEKTYWHCIFGWQGNNQLEVFDTGVRPFTRYLLDCSKMRVE
ncbi:MAG: hypothetical protein NT023_09905 [Armatimonadetes bacterium]|nr:hypothetical protein [Armatimonadota bacterium]